jgi:hypothetical protein
MSKRIENNQMSKRITIDIEGEALEGLEKFRKDHYLSYLSEALKLCLYQIIHDEVGKPPPTKEEAIKKKALNYEERKALREKEKKEELTKIATDAYPDGLAGKVSVDGKKVTYFVYFERGRDEVTINLSEVTKDLVNYQYQPSYEEIARMQAEGLIDYK